MEGQKPELYTVQEVADRLRISRVTVGRMIADREISAVGVRGSYRIPAAALDEYLQGNTTTAMIPLASEKVQL